MAVAEQALPVFHTRLAIFAIQVGTFVRPASNLAAVFHTFFFGGGGKRETLLQRVPERDPAVFTPPSVSEPLPSSNAEKNILILSQVLLDPARYHHLRVK